MATSQFVVVVALLIAFSTFNQVRLLRVDAAWMSSSEGFDALLTDHVRKHRDVYGSIVPYTPQDDDTSAGETPNSVIFKGHPFAVTWDDQEVTLTSGDRVWSVYKGDQDHKVIKPDTQNLQNGHAFFFTEPDLRLWQVHLPADANQDEVVAVPGTMTLHDFEDVDGDTKPQDIIFASQAGDMIANFCSDRSGDIHFHTKSNSSYMWRFPRVHRRECNTEDPLVFQDGQFCFASEHFKVDTMRFGVFDMTAMKGIHPVTTDIIPWEYRSGGYLMNHPQHGIYTFVSKEHKDIILKIGIQDDGFLSLSNDTKIGVRLWE